MPIMQGIQYIPSHASGLRINPIGIVLHRTAVAGYQHLLQRFQAGPKSPHFLIGKDDGQAAQLVDTDLMAAHVKGANHLYIGIEFESVTAKTKGLDPQIILDDLTPFQIDEGKEVIDWICRTHSIPKFGPPSSTAWKKCRGHWNGVLGHSNVAEGPFFATTHGDTLQFIDFIALGVWPAKGDAPRYKY